MGWESVHTDNEQRGQARGAATSDCTCWEGEGGRGRQRVPVAERRGTQLVAGGEGMWREIRWAMKAGGRKKRLGRFSDVIHCHEGGVHGAGPWTTHGCMHAYRLFAFRCLISDGRVQ